MAGETKSVTKKRPSSDQSGTKFKKPHLDKPSNAEKKRSRPVTVAMVRKIDSDSESEDRIDELEKEGEDYDEEQNEENEAMDEDIPTKSSDAPIKDPNASRESHKAQKVLQDQRRAAKPHSTLLTDAKREWSLARQKNLPTAERQKHVQDLMNVIRGKVKDIVFKHDASRIVQTVVKYGRQKERDEIAAELKGRYKELAQNKYSKFLVTKLIRLCPTHRPLILMEFQSQVLRLLLHREASAVLADSFELHANAYERAILLRDFYGKEASLFTITSGTNEDKERTKRGLIGILDGADDERKRRTLSALKENLLTIFNNSDKGAVTHAIVHRALWEYLVAAQSVSGESEQEKLRREIFENCQEVLAEMVHTRDGSRVVREFLAWGTAKDRKQILKVLKPHVERMCMDDEAQLVLFTALDVIDDTKMMSKSLISEMTTPASKLYASSQGRRSLLYLLVPRTRRHFTPAQIASLAETDEIRSRTSKKTPEARADEVRKFASEALISWVSAQGATVLRDPGGSLVVAEVMLYADGDKSEAIQSLLKPLSSSYPSTDPASPHPIDISHVSRLYKTLLQGGHFNHTSKSIERSPYWDAGKFAVAFVDFVGEEVAVGMCTKGDCNGAFVMAEACETLLKGGFEGDKIAREQLKTWFGPGTQKDVASSSAKGKTLLLEKIGLL